MKDIELSIIIVNWNSWDVLCDCIKSVYDTVKAGFEIILVDNNSTDDSVYLVRQTFPEVKILQQKQNLGFSKAANIGFSESAGQYVLFLNPDVILKKDAIDGMLALLKARDGVGIVGPRIMRPDGLPDFEYNGKSPSLYYNFLKIFLITKITTFIRYGLYSFTVFRPIIERRYAVSGERQFVEGSCMMIRRQVFAALEGFDERVEMYLDDIDLCYRVRKMSLKNYYLASSEIIHLKQYSTKKTINPKIYDITSMKAEVYYYRKHFGPTKAALYKMFILFSMPYLLILNILSLPYYLLRNRANENFQLFKKHLQYLDILRM